MNVAFIAPLREHVVVLTLKSFYFASVVRGSIAEEVIDLIALMANRYRSASILQRHQPNQQLLYQCCMGSIAEEMIDLIALMANRYRSASILQQHQPNQQLLYQCCMGSIVEEMIDLIALMANRYRSASIFSGISRISNSAVPQTYCIL